MSDYFKFRTIHISSIVVFFHLLFTDMELDETPIFQILVHC
jgi:hypothetical protein